jgi:hypothetical protein
MFYKIESSKLNVDKYLKEKVSDLQQKISTTVSEIKVEAANFNNSVASAGLLQATKYKFNEVKVLYLARFTYFFSYDSTLYSF